MVPVPALPVEAVLFDLDGTLYRQAPLRRRMLGELARAPLREGPRGAYRIARRLRTFRRVREELRDLGRPLEPLEDLQYSVPAERLGERSEEVRDTVFEWMVERPLPHLPPCARPGLADVLGRLQERGLRLGVFSDYPVEEKLTVLGVRDRFDLLLCAVEREVNAFKPHPRGFQVAAERWSVPPERVLYVGDRPEVDGEGARAAGMRCVIVGAKGGRSEDLAEVLRAVEG